jgi:hypothetical protein
MAELLSRSINANCEIAEQRAKPDKINRKQYDVQDKDRHIHPHGSIPDETNICSYRQDAHGQHRSLCKGGKCQTRCAIA